MGNLGRGGSPLQRCSQYILQPSFTKQLNQFDFTDEKKKDLHYMYIHKISIKEKLSFICSQNQYWFQESKS